MQPGKIDPSRIRPARNHDAEATVIILAAGLVLACCCGAGIVGALWAVIG